MQANGSPKETGDEATTASKRIWCNIQTEGKPVLVDWLRQRRQAARREHEQHAHGRRESGAQVALGRRREGRAGDAETRTPPWEQAVEDVINDFTTNGKRSLKVVQRRIAKHLTPFFGGRRLMNITTADIRRYIAHRQGATTMVRNAYEVVRKDGSVYRVAEHRRN